jgi:hypothetical protein
LRRSEPRGLSPSDDFGSYPKPARNLSVTVSTSDSFQLNLYLARDTFAFRSTADYLDTSPGSHKTILVPAPASGRWYVGVECATTVTTYGDSCFLYNDSLHVLNGVAYDITATWDTSGAVAEPRPSPVASRPSLSAFPNPFRASALIRLPPQLQTAACKLVTIYDAAGRLVASSPDPISALVATPSGYVWKPSPGTRAGVYVIRIQTTERTATTRVVFAR